MDIFEDFERLPLRVVLFADSVFEHAEGKTAQGILRHSEALHPIAVVDRFCTASNSGEVVAGTDVPVVSSVREALSLEPDALVMALTESDHVERIDGAVRHAPKPPGDLPAFWREEITTALAHGLDVISCLHLRLAESELARGLRKGQLIVDVRKPYEELPKYSGRRERTRAKVVHVTGSDCVIGKRTAALQLYREARERGIEAGYVGTGQTCLLVGCTEGAIVDRTPVFQAAGLVEHLVLRAESRHDLLVIKGQASVLHPAFGGLATAILQGAQPDAVVFVHDPQRQFRYHWEHIALGPVEREIELVEQLGGAPVVALATRGEENVQRLRYLGLPVVDALAPDGPSRLLGAVSSALEQQVRLPNRVAV
ncbi:DUF1611 domain-containing protein [Streptomyces sp. NPDC048664]|uniref:DUF1611 domain-containing protein n=1 Tax=Streptomyces sp. NPDC048664 TaxID=3154505 RepID=UPI00343761B4